MRGILVVISFLLLSPSAGATVLCPGGSGQAPYWAHSELDCQSSPRPRRPDPREKEAEQKAQAAQKVRDRLESDRQKAAATPEIDRSRPYELPPPLAHTAASLASQDAKTPSVPRTYGELLGEPNPVQQWKAFVTKTNEDVVAIKMNRPKVATGYQVGAPAPAQEARRVVVTGALATGVAPLRSFGGSRKASNPAAAKPADASPAANSEAIGSGAALTAEASNAEKGGGPAPESKQAQLKVPSSSTIDEGSDALKKLDGRVSRAERPDQKDKKPSGGDGKSALAAPFEELGFFERALDMVDSVRAAVVNPQEEPTAFSIFARVHAQYRKRENLLAH